MPESFDSMPAEPEQADASAVRTTDTQPSPAVPHRIYVENSRPIETPVVGERRILTERANVAVSMLGVVLLIAQIVKVEETSESKDDLIHVLDTVFCFLLLTDFGYAWFNSRDKMRFLKRRWWEPLASIPMIDSATQGFLAVRLLRILRLLRIFKLHVSIREYARQGQAFLERNRVQELGSIILLTIITGALGFYYAEQGVNPNLHSFRDSVWWAMVTVTTIGYGDIYPVTTAGRLIAGLLMIIGIGTVSLFTGLVAAGVIRENNCPHCGERL